MHFGPIKETIECLLVFFAQSPPQWFQSFTLGFQRMAKKDEKRSWVMVNGAPVVTEVLGSIMMKR
jgi:hypothetical protein